MATRKIVPRADNEGGIGTALKQWASGWIKALTVTTLNALTLAAAAVGFTIAGGTTSKTLTLTTDVTLGLQIAWTPIIVGSVTPGTGTYSAQVGRYVRIGPLIIALANVTWSAHTGAGSQLIGGLPIVSSSVATYQPVVINDNVALAAGTILRNYIGPSVEVITQLIHTLSTGSDATLSLQTSGNYTILAVYFV